MLEQNQGTKAGFIMSDKARRIDFSPDELIAGTTSKLSVVEFGVYWMVCTLIYSQGGPIDDDAEWIAGVFKKTNPRTVRAALEKLVALSKIYRIDSQLMVNRCRTELERASNRIRTASENGSNGGRPSKKNNDLEKPAALKTEKLAGATTINESTINCKDSSRRSESLPMKIEASRASRIDPAWEPGDVGVEFAVKAGLPEDRIRIEADKFKDHFLQSSLKTALKRDWQAAWRNWVRGAADGFTARNGGSNGQLEFGGNSIIPPRGNTNGGRTQGGGRDTPGIFEAGAGALDKVNRLTGSEGRWPD